MNIFLNKNGIRKSNFSWKLIIRPLKFGIVGVFNSTIDFSLFMFFIQVLGWHILPANIISYGAGVLNSFIMNKLWTFQDHRPFSLSMNPFICFVLINISSLILSSFLVWLISQHLTAAISKIISIGIVFIWNYSLTRMLVFQMPDKDSTRY